jgi:hypothetical protein
VIESPRRLVAVDASVAVEIAQELFLLGIHTQHRLAVGEVLISERPEVTELRLSIRRLTTGQDFGDLPQPAAERLEHPPHDAIGHLHVGLLLNQFREFARRPVGPQRRVNHRIARRAMPERFFELLDNFRMLLLSTRMSGSGASSAIAQWHSLCGIRPVSRTR